MKTYITLALAGLAMLCTVACKKNDGQLSDKPQDRIAIDSTKVAAFFTQYPDFKPFKKEFKELYSKHKYHYVWYDKDGRVEFAEVLYSKVNQLSAEGVPVTVPYKDKIDAIFDKDSNKPNEANELLISGMYFFYAQKVFVGVDTKKSRATGWYLPRDKMDYIAYLDELVRDADKITETEAENVPQYYNLKKGLQQFRAIKSKGGWAKINFPADLKMLKPGDKNPAIVQVKKRLEVTGEYTGNENDEYDSNLADAVTAYRKRNNILGENLTQMLVDHMNVPVEARIKTIIVNMERCRWLDPDIAKAKELISVNIPAYQMRYQRDGKTVLESNVVVGNEANKTVVFSGQLSYLVFSPYWNVPKSIIAKEIQPGIDKDADYLEKHNMEWNDGNVRQKPGEDNSLGLIKFMFPNSNNIYLHDTPAKSLFGKDERALSHGCVRVQKARDLAVSILDDDKNWNAQKIDAAMHAGTEKQYALNHKIPVYIAYFTAWPSTDGHLAFYEDVYSRDNRLARLLYTQSN